MRHPKVRTAVISAFWTVVVAYFVFTSLILVTRWYLLPQVNRFKEPIAQAVGTAVGGSVQIGSIVPHWDAFWPRLSLRNVTLSKPDTATGNVIVLRLPEVEATVYWRSLLGEVRFRDLVIADARLTVRKLSQYVYDVAGFTIDLTPKAENEQGSKQTSADSGFLSWLLKQHRLSIIDSSVEYIDTLSPHSSPSRLEKIDFTFENRPTDYAVGLQAVLDAPGRNTIDLRAQFTTPLFEQSDWRQWQGQLYFAASQLDFAKLLSPSDLLSKFVSSGIGSSRTWIDFANARPVSITSDLALHELTLQLSDEVEPLHMNRLSARVIEQLEGDNLTIEAHNLVYELADGTRSRTPRIGMRVLLAPGKLDTRTAYLRFAQIDLETIQKLLPSIPLPAAAAQLIAERAPSGKLIETAVNWRGPARNPADWSISSDFSGITIEAVAANPANGRSMTPGVRNFSGNFQASNDGGRISLNTTNGSLTFPGIFEHPTIEAGALTGDVYWTRQNGQPIVTFERIHVVNADADVSAQGTWRADPAAGPAGVADITGTIARAQAASVWKYMPLVIGKPVRDWLQNGLVSGTAQNGTFEIRGPFKGFPWVKDPKSGRFYVGADVVNAAIDYVPDRVSKKKGALWPLLTDINGRIAFEGLSMRVEADRAKTFGVDVGKTTAVIANLAGGSSTLLDIDGDAQGSLQRMFDYVEASPVGGFIGHAFKSTRAEGEAQLSLALDIPLLHAKDTRVSGAVTMSGNHVEMPRPIPPLAEVQGTVRFNEKGASAQRVLAKPFGKEDSTVNVITAQDGTISVTASGSIDVADIGWFADTPIVRTLLEHASGTTPYLATVAVSRKKGVTVTAQTPLTGVSINLPEPLKKSAEQRWPVRFSSTPVAIAGETGTMLSVDAGNKFDVLLQLPFGENSKLAVRGAIGIGTQLGLPVENFSLAVKAGRVALPQWSDHIASIIEAAVPQPKSAESAAADGDPAEAVASVLAEVNLDIAEAVFTDLSLKGLKANYRHQHDNWALDIDSDRISGAIRYDNSQQGLLALDMQRLNISEGAAHMLRRFIEGKPIDEKNSSRNKTQASASAAPHPRHLPRISARIGSLSYDKFNLGSAQFETSVNRKGAAEGLSIDKCILTSPSGHLTASGSWTRSLARGASDQTAINASWDIKNAGNLLDELGIPGVIEGADGMLKANLSYAGSPWSPKLETLSGDLAVDFSKGSFMQVDTGPGGALLSLLSFQSLLKRLTLDFTDLVQQGFSFDRFTGSATIAAGVSTTDNTKIVGSQATVLLSGKADFYSQKLNTHAVVLPDINAGNASLALAFVNPAVGIGTFLAQLLLRNPLSQMFKVEYDITGSFDNPVITKTSAPEGKLQREPSNN